MSYFYTITKDPSAVLDYEWDWSEWLMTNEAITSHTVTVPTELTKAQDSHSATAVIAWLSGGTAGKDYQATCQITTSGGRTDARTIVIHVTQR